MRPNYPVRLTLPLRSTSLWLSDHTYSPTPQPVSYVTTSNAIIAACPIGMPGNEGHIRVTSLCVYMLQCVHAISTSRVCYTSTD